MGTMKATGQIDKLKSDECRQTVIRNLSRILDIRILDIDMENKTLSFACDSAGVIKKVKRELHSIGYPLNRLHKSEPYTKLSH
jgi:hypothetical protein